MDNGKKEGWVKSLEVMLSKGDFPLSKADALYKLDYLQVEGKPMGPMLDKIQWPVRSRDELVTKLQQAKGNA